MRESLRCVSNWDTAKALFTAKQAAADTGRIAVVGVYFKTCSDRKKLDELLPAA